MIIKPGDAERFIAKPPAKILAVLFYGPDQGLVHERAETIAKTVVDDLTDPFRVTELDDATLSADPARLADEAAAMSMMGGRRVVRVRGASNAHAKIFENFLDGAGGDSLVVVEAGELNKGAALRKLFEDSDEAAAIACYPDSARDLPGVVRAALKEAGLGIGAEALDDAVSRLGADRGVTRRELEKLVLYAHGQSRVELADVRAVMGDETEIRTEEALDAAGEGNLPKLDRALQRLWTADMNAIAVIRTALGHFQKLALAKSAAARGDSVDQVMRRMRPPIHFSRANSFKAQLQRWNEERINMALDQLLETEALCKTTAIPTEAVCSRALFSIAAMARLRN